MSNHYGYIRFSPKIPNFDERIESFKSYDELSLIVEKGVKGHVDINERNEFTKLKEGLKSGDTLVVWWIDELGRNFKTCLSTLTALIEDGIDVKTIEQDLLFKKDDLASRAMISLITGYAEAEDRNRLIAAEFGRRALKENPNEWKEKFRGRQKDHGLHQAIAQALLEGKTLQQTSEETGASLSTVKRVKAKLRGDDELGQMRTRGHHGHGRGHGRREGKHAGKGKMMGRGRSERFASEERVESTDSE